MSLNIIYGDPFLAAEQKGWSSSLTEVLNPPSHTLILVPSNVIKLHLQERLLQVSPQQSLLGVSVTNIESLLERLCMQYNVPNGVFSTLFNQRLIETLLLLLSKKESLSSLQSIIEKPGLHNALLAMIQRLENNLISPSDFERLETPSPYLEDFKKIYQTYYDFIKGTLNSTENKKQGSLKTSNLIKYQQLIRGLQKEDLSIDSLPSIIIYGYGSLPVNLSELIKAYSKIKNVTLILPSASFVYPLLKESVNELQALHPGAEVHHIEDRIKGPKTTLVETHSAYFEYQFVAEKIFQLSQSIPSQSLKDMVIYSSDPLKDFPLFKKELQTYGIPCSLTEKIPLAHHPVIHFMENFVQLAAQFYRDQIACPQLVSFLEDPLFLQQTKHLLNEEELCLVSQGTLFKISQFLHPTISARKLHQELKQLKDLSPNGFPSLGMEELHRIQEFINKIGHHLTDSLQSKMTLLDFFSTLKEITEEFAVDPQIMICLKSLWQQEELFIDLHHHLYQGKLSLYECSKVLSDLTRQTEFSLPEISKEGVLLTSYRNLVSRRFDYAFYLHCNEGSFPAGGASSPLFDETELLKMNQELGTRLNTTLEQIAIDEALFNYNLSSRIQKEVFLISHEFDSRGRPSAPSILLKEFHQKESEKIHYIPPLLKRKGSRQELEEKLSLYKAAHLPSTLSSPSFTFTLNTYLKKRLSASALENFAFCPYRFFAERILKLSPSSPPALDHLVMGNLIHHLLERLFKEPRFTKNIGQAFQKVEPLVAQEMEILLKPFSKLNWYNPVINQYLRHSLLDKIQRVFELESQLKEEFKTNFSYATEVPIAGIIEVDSHFKQIEFHTEGKETSQSRWIIPFIGRIDRVDTEKNKFIIIDYKDSSSQNNSLGKSVFLKGERFQIPLYLEFLKLTKRQGFTPIAAFYHHLKDGVKKYGLFWHEFNGEHFKLSSSLGSCIKDESTWQHLLTENKKHILQILEKIHTGDFEPDPADPLNCERCDYPTLCRFSKTDVRIPCP